MAAIKVPGTLNCGISDKKCEIRTVGKGISNKSFVGFLGNGNSYVGATRRRGLRSDIVVKNCGLASDHQALDYEVGPSSWEERLASTREILLNSSLEESVYDSYFTHL